MRTTRVEWKLKRQIGTDYCGVDVKLGSVTGDLQESGINRMTTYYDGTDSLDVDVYQVGHHGSHNATTDDLLTAMTPDMAVFSVGRYNDDAGTINAPKYGHPRKGIAEDLNEAIGPERSRAKWVKVFEEPWEPLNYLVTQQVYATAWDGNVVVQADLSGYFWPPTTFRRSAPPRDRRPFRFLRRPWRGR